MASRFMKKRTAAILARIAGAMRGMLAQCYIFNGDDDAAERLLGLDRDRTETDPEGAHVRLQCCL